MKGPITQLDRDYRLHLPRKSSPLTNFSISSVVVQLKGQLTLGMGSANRYAVSRAVETMCVLCSAVSLW
jgi:hypothetical protein